MINFWLYCLFALLVLNIDTGAAKKKNSLADGIQTTESIGALGQGFPIHDMDLTTKQFQSTGAKIFEDLDYDKCVVSDKLGITSKDDTYYTDTESLYSSISTDSKIEASLTGAYTLGTSVQAVTNNIASANKEVSGLSLNLKASSVSHELKKECINSASLSKQFLEDFEGLNAAIDNPWESTSWRKYKASEIRSPTSRCYD